MLSVLAFFLRAFLEIILEFFADAYDCITGTMRSSQTAG